MKLACYLMPLLLSVSGCAYMSSQTIRSTNPTTGTVTEITRAKAYAVFDSNAALTKFSNRSGYVSGTNVYAPGTYISGLNESSSSTNLVSILSAVAQGVANGLKP